jgi:hypothetical protein
MVSVRTRETGTWEIKNQQVGNAETISAIEEPRVRLPQVPIIQHQVTLAGPPVSNGVLRVVATDEVTPIIENANDVVDKVENSRSNESMRV